MIYLPQKKLIFVISLLVILSCISSCSSSIKEPAVFTKSQILFGTVVKITLCGEKAEENVNLLFKKLQHLNNIFNTYNPNSMISRLNIKKKIVTNEIDLYKILLLSKSFGKITNGAFDVTIEPLIKLYRNYRIKKIVPPYKSIKQTLKYINYNNIHLKKLKENKSLIYLEPNTSIDLGGVAKGYAVEEASKLLKNKKINYAIIDAGGNLKVIGNLPFNKKWTVGIQHPRKTNKTIAKINIYSEDAVSTSGDYFRYFIYGGRRYHHILDPKTGYSANKYQSVTVIGKNSAITDILSTAIFVLGPKNLGSLTKKITKLFPNENYRIYIVDSDGKLSSSHLGEDL